MKMSSEIIAGSYNSLFGIADASRELDRRGGDQVVGKYLKVIYDAGFGKEIGLRLLHKHNDISPREVMLESEFFDDEGFALVTEATPVSDRPDIIPNSWIATPQGYIAVEFSKRSLLQPVVHEIDEMLQELAKTLLSDEMADILGPSINYSEFVDAQAPYSDSAFLEKTDYEHRANVVRYVQRGDPAIRHSAKTKWHAKRTRDHDGNPVWLASCNCFCSVAPQGGHLGTKTHRYTP